MPSKKPAQKPKEPPITGPEIKKWRVGHGLTQAEAAEWLNASPRTYENWESGHRSPFHPALVRDRMRLKDERVRRVGPRKRELVPRGK